MAMIQKRDGSFSDFMSIDELESQFEAQMQLLKLRMCPEAAHELRNGSWDDCLNSDPTEDFKDAFYCDADFPKAIHFGTKQELQAIKERVTVEQRLDILEDQMKELEVRRNAHVHIPSQDEIRQFVKEDVKLKTAS
jgi:hypothetical protein